MLQMFSTFVVCVKVPVTVFLLIGTDLLLVCSICVCLILWVFCDLLSVIHLTVLCLLVVEIYYPLHTVYLYLGSSGSLLLLLKWNLALV